MARPSPSNKNKKIAHNPELASRFLTLEALRDDSIHALPTDRIWTLADRYEIPVQRRPLAYDLLTGVIKRRLTLDHLLETISGRRTRQIDPVILSILRLGVYQLLFEDSVPDFAAVDTSCELARAFQGTRQVGFVNAVLRNVQRAIASKNVSINADTATFVVPVGLNAGVRFSKPVLPEPADVVEYLSLAWSYPRWLVERWSKQWDQDTLRQILSAGNARPGLHVRPNILRVSAQRLAELLTQQGCRVRLTQDGDLVELIEHPPITELGAFRDGLFQVQDPTAAQPVRNLSLPAGGKILDLCAGLGTKTTQLAELTDNQAQIIASDRTESKLHKLQLNADRLGLHSITTITIDQLEKDEFKKAFDIVLLDVPCSNTGVFDRRAEARWRLRQEDFQSYIIQSRQLLECAERLVKDEGQILFSTCSIEAEENEACVKDFCVGRSWKIVREHVQLPRLDCETGKTCCTGGYWAIVGR